MSALSLIAELIDGFVVKISWPSVTSDHNSDLGVAFDSPQ